MSGILDTAYVNHTSKVSLHQDVLADLYENRLVGIHYDDFPSLNETEWKEVFDDSTGGNAVSRLCEYAEEGRILTASYTGHPDLGGGRLVGTVGPTNRTADSEVFLIICRNRKGNDHERGIVDWMRVEPGAKRSKIESKADTLNSDAEEAVKQAIENNGFDEDDPDHRIIKGLAFNEDVDWVWNRDFPGLWAANKRQTIAGWNTGYVHLYAAYYAACDSGLEDMWEVNEKLPENKQKKPVKLLSEGQLEVLCSQYLRRTYPNYFETMPVGGSLSGVDIVGKSQGEEILAQVTFTSDVEEKFRRLLSYANHSTTDDVVHFYFFGPKEGKTNISDKVADEMIDEVYTSIESVFDEFAADGPNFTETNVGQESPESILNQLLEIELSTDDAPRIN